MNAIASTPARTGAAFARGKSIQTHGTPPEFISAVEMKFGPLAWDLAALKENSVCGANYFGPDQRKESFRDSLAQDWGDREGNLWLNPPFADIGPWAAKCATHRHRQDWILLLVPYSTGANWYLEHVRGQCIEIPLNGRVRFVGSAQGYVKDLALFAYGFGLSGMAEPWRWEAGKRWRLAKRVRA